MMPLSRRMLLIATAALAAPATAFAADAPLHLKWAELVPPAPPKPPKSFLAGRAPSDTTAPPPQSAEGRWMSSPTQQQMSTPPEVVTSLNGKRVQIGGYIVPLDFDATSVKEFLLVPFVGACIHVPPPPANQIVYVKSAKGFDVKQTFDPVYVTGLLTTATAFTGLAAAGYTIEADLVEARKE